MYQWGTHLSVQLSHGSLEIVTGYQEEEEEEPERIALFFFLPSAGKLFLVVLWCAMQTLPSPS